MRDGTWYGYKTQITKLIKKISDHYGGDDPDWLAAYTAEVIETNAEDLRKAYDALMLLSGQLNFVPRRATGISS